MLRIGQTAPAFSLPSTSGRTVSLADLRGKRVVLYFYPRDDTPGCTREACAFRDHTQALAKSGAVVLGVSGDSLAAHAKFRGKYELPFELLSDAGNRVATAYGAYGEKLLYGRKIVGTIRSTFVIDEHGKLATLWSKVKVDGHVERVLAALAGPGAPPPTTAPKKASVRKRTFAQPASAKAGEASGKAASARASKIGRGYRTPTRVKGHKSRRGSVK